MAHVTTELQPAGAKKLNDAGVLACVDCDAALELTCPNGHEVAWFKVESGDVRDVRRELAAARRDVAAVRRERDRLVRELDRFTRRNLELEARGAARSPKVPEDPRGATPRRTLVFKDKPCACGMMFTPTGGRDTECPACRAITAGDLAAVG